MELHIPMRPRDPREAHRVSTPLELFVDLAFVVAVAQAAASLHHGLVEGHGGDVVGGFVMVFFAIWWAWMNFTWFASAYDTDDAAYRIAVLVQMAGVLVLAAGVPRLIDADDASVVVAGYVVMRLALVGLWLRAAAFDRVGRSMALRYAAGVSTLQVLWVAWLALPDAARIPIFLILAVGEMAVPIWAERSVRTSWHPSHIAERYGLFTIIVLGESVLAATLGVQAALDADARVGDLATVIAGGLLVVFSMWWLYFDLPDEEIVERVRAAFSERMHGAFAWGYGHFAVFASVAATGAGLAIAVDQATGHSALTDTEAGLALALPVSVYLAVLWLLHLPHAQQGPIRRVAMPLAVVAMLAAAFTPEPVLIGGLVLAALVAISVLAPPATADVT